MNRKFLSARLIIGILLVTLSLPLLYSSVDQSRENPAIALVLDRSGSMGYSNYLTPAKQRAQTFVGLMQDGDQVAVASYSETASVNFAITTIAGAATITAAQNAINTLQSGGRTSIGSGLVAGRNQLTTSSTTGQKAMILLSDGLDNLAPFAINIVPGIPTSMNVYTIALGPNSDQQLLQWIANQTGGTYHYAPNTAVLQQIYDTISGSLRGYQNYHTTNDVIEPLETVTNSVIIDPAEYLYFTVTSDEELSPDLSALSFSLINSSGEEINELNIVDEGFGEMTTGFSYRSYRINQPEAGTWQMIISNSTNDRSLNYDLSVWGLSNIELQQILPEENLVVNEPLELIVQLFDNGIPLSNCTVTARIISPEQDTRINRSSTFPFEERTGRNRFNRDVLRDTEIEIILTENEAGRYEALYYDTAVAGSYIVEILALIDNNDQIIQRKNLGSFYFAPPDEIPAPLLLYPDNFAQNLATAIDFIWTPVLNADSYQIQVANEQEIIMDYGNIYQNSLILDLPDYNTDYMWRVRALVGEQEGVWSEVFHFATGIPDIPTPNNLQGYLDNNCIVLTWEQPEFDEFYGDPWYYKIYRDNNYYGYTLLPDSSFLDEFIYPNQPYSYYVTAYYYTGDESLPSNITTLTFVNADTPEAIILSTGLKYNYPNPFNPSTRIVFSLTESGNVSLVIYDIEGRVVDKIFDGYLESGEHEIIWRGTNSDQRDVPSGIYIIKMSTAGYTGHKKLLLLK